jgi:hypothetical protein
MAKTNNRFSEIALDFAKRENTEISKIPNIIEYIESYWGLSQRLFPVQKFILKLYYFLPLDDKIKSIEIYDRFKENLLYTFTEVEYLHYLWNEGRVNIPEQDHIRNELILAIGRRGSKTAMSGFICSYEMYRLLSMHDPHKFYGIPDSNRIGIISVATDKEQAGLLFNEVSGHTTSCELFRPYVQSETLSALRIWSPAQKEKFGEFSHPKLYVTFKACIAKGLRGPGNIVIVLDELAHFTEQGQTSAEDIYKAITPSITAFTPKDPNDSQRILSEYSDGKIISISSPLDDSGQFYKLYETAMAGGPASRNMLCIQAPSWEVNKTLPGQTLKDEYYKNPESFMIEFGAQFSGRSTKFIDRKEDLFLCVDPNRKPVARGVHKTSYFMGVDVGLVEDGTSISITHVEGENIILDYHDTRSAGHGAYAAYERLDLEDHVINWIVELCDLFYIEKGIFDQWHGVGLESFLSKRGLYQFSSVHMSADLNSKMYQNFLTLMFTKRLDLYDYPIPKDTSYTAHSPLITELLSLKKERKSKNIIVVEAPKIVGKHDDASDSLVRSIWLASEGLRSTNKKDSKTSKNRMSKTETLSSMESQYRRYRNRKQRSCDSRLESARMRVGNTVKNRSLYGH